ncbi:TetR/AcrR family transcriptional regulator [Ohessyouella blattaphilus]|uniref:WHG domain-containing protein n=1 Tax=Ohessyouella blattaphilus TaxID=2949333 RepID=A0ABT1EGA5_9FIRM|nr:TetR/AcrR family transcriptional regulator [Ohessyouella blattaphilus]MCP1109519.1 WHG domain-containing protein [Ohessyouella blattaphilus]MCR8562913.1 WHG domain-containing protein [Ohessyouella blattaphilus]MDL2250093.1 WHG domain-containing protein [Lachnospiraceae bacterium OttesenSCG-928-J05]
MSRKGLDTETVVKVAAEITDELGFDKVTLKEISERLGVRSPSLYNHIDNLSDLKEMVSTYAMELARDNLVKATRGRTGIDALKEMGRCYIRFAREHAGLYETIQWMNINSGVERDSLFSEVVQLVCDIAEGVGTTELEASHIIRTVRSLAHGFASVESHHGFSHPSSVESSYEYALDMFFYGIKVSQEKESREASSV